MDVPSWTSSKLDLRELLIDETQYAKERIDLEFPIAIASMMLASMTEARALLACRHVRNAQTTAWEPMPKLPTDYVSRPYGYVFN